MLESHRQEIAKLEALYASNPGGRVFVHLAEALRKGGEHERARNILQEGLARHPDSASGFVVLGRLLADMGETGEAETAFRQVLDLDGGNLVALRCLGDLARESGRRDDAIRLYRELMARNPSSDDVAAQLRTLELEPAAAPASPGEAAAEDNAAADESAASVAPGRTDRSARAEPEFGVIELAALPGELGVFAGLAQPQHVPAGDEAEAATQELDDDAVAMIESSAAPLQLEELDHELAAAPVELNILSAAPELDAPAWDAPQAEPDRAEEPAAEVEVEVPSAASVLTTPEEDAPADDAQAAEEFVAGDETTPAAWHAPADEAQPTDEFVADAPPTPAAQAGITAAEVDDLFADAEPHIESGYAGVAGDASETADETVKIALPDQWAPAEEPVADEFAEPLNISDLSGETREVIADAALDLADLAPTAEFVMADEAVSAAVDAVVEYEEEVSAFASVGFDEPLAEETVPVEAVGFALYDDAAAAVGPEPAEPLGDDVTEPAAVASPEPVEAEPEWAPMDEAEPRLEPVWAADSDTDLETLLAGPADVTSEPYGFEVEEPGAAQVSEELQYWSGAAELPESEQAEALEEPGAVPAEAMLEAETTPDEMAVPASLAGDEAPAGLEADSGDVVTETLADLYLSQGFAERAATVYRALLRRQPGEERLVAKLAEAETSRAAAAEEAGEVWLRGVESAWTGGAGAAGGETTPYTWTEREEREEGVGIGAYLRELIQWGAELRAVEETAQEADEAAPPAAAPTAEPLPWETPFASADEPAAADPWAVPSEAADSELEAPAGGATQDADSWSMTAEPMLDEGWGETAPDPWAAIPETPADPWLAPEPAGIDVAPPAPAPAQAARSPSGNPVEDAFHEWFDQPTLPASARAAQDAVAAAAEPTAGGDDTASAEDEDEDLEMFRAWLQSLKK